MIEAWLLALSLQSADGRWAHVRPNTWKVLGEADNRTALALISVPETATVHLQTEYLAGQGRSQQERLVFDCPLGKVWITSRLRYPGANAAGTPVAETPVGWQTVTPGIAPPCSSFTVP